MTVFRIAHLSDPHVLDLTGVSTSQLVLNKRLTGWVNIRVRRSSHHKAWMVEALLDDLARNPVDHVVITGDLTNLALDPEFARMRAMLDRLRLPPDAVSVIPGNHDLYTRGAQRTKRFASHFAPFLTSDLEVGGDHHPSGPFPFVRLRGPVAIIGLSTAVARLPLVASGWAGDAQIAALRRVLEHREVRDRTPVVLSHHPLGNSRSALERLLRGWSDAHLVRDALCNAREALALHGHLHHRVHEVIPTPGGRIHRLGATSASLLADDPRAVGGYNLYEISPEKGLAGLRARVWNVDTRSVVDAALPSPRA